MLGLATAIGGVSGGVYLLEKYRSLKPRHLRWTDLEQAIRALKHQMRTDGFQPDLVVGLRRSGGVVGGILAGVMGTVPLAIVDWDYEWASGQREIKRLALNLSPEALAGKRVLLVDGRPRTGATLAAVRRKLDEFASGNAPAVIKVAAVFTQGIGPLEFDYVGMEVRDLDLLENPPWKISDPEYREDWRPPPH